MFDKIIKKIRPSKEEELEVSKKVGEFFNTINKKLKNTKVIAGGSFAKGTWLSGQHDIDIFVCFNKNKDISKRLESAVKSCFKKYEMVHGSRDYFIVEFKDLSFELIPVLKINKAEEAENITDVSPMHVGFVKKHTNKKLCDEIRLTKQFLKANGCYGAETYIGGFSGYLAELLVIYYGGFRKFIKSVSGWKYGEIIKITKENEFVSEQIFPLVVIDPVQPNRNASAALREEKFNLFIDICKKFISKPNTGYFTQKKINLKKYDLVLEATPLPGSRDVSGTKMLKAFEFIKMKLNEEGFKVADYGWFWDDYGYFYFNIKNKKLDKFRKHYGPPVKFIKDVEKFKNKYKKYKIGLENHRVVVVLPRKFTDFRKFTTKLIKNEQVKSRVKNIKIVHRKLFK